MWRITINSDFKSLLWVPALITLMSFASISANIIYVDILHHNPYRSISHALTIPFLFAPFMLIISTIISFLCISIPALVQTITTALTLKKYCVEKLYLALAILPLSSFVGWYIYNWLPIHNLNLGINEGANWQPYTHEFTWGRYLGAFAFYSTFTAFSLIRLYFTAKNQPRKKRIFTLTIIILGILFATIRGYSP